MIRNQKSRTDGLLAVVYFLLSALLTGLFIVPKFWLYSNMGAMIASGSIAAAKWLLQIGAALILLNSKKWEFIKRMGGVCLVGSCILFSYNLMDLLALPLSGFSQFILAIALAILAMIILYYRAVKKTGLSVKWFSGLDALFSYCHSFTGNSGLLKLLTSSVFLKSTLMNTETIFQKAIARHENHKRGRKQRHQAKPLDLTRTLFLESI